MRGKNLPQLSALYSRKMVRAGYGGGGMYGFICLGREYISNQITYIYMATSIIPSPLPGCPPGSQTHAEEITQQLQ